MSISAIENFEGDADRFEFPYNPQSFDSSLESNAQFNNLAYQRHHILVAGKGGANPNNIPLAGHFSGESRWDDYRKLSGHFGENNRLKKLFFESDKFSLGVPFGLKRTHSSGRTNFIDYVFQFNTVVSMLFGAEEKTSGVNEGNSDTFVFEVSGQISDGGSDVVLEDGVGRVITVSSGNFSSGDSFLYKFVEMVDSGSGIKVSQYGNVYINGDLVRGVSSSEGFKVLEIKKGESVSSVSVSNLDDFEVKFRDGYAD